MEVNNRIPWIARRKGLGVEFIEWVKVSSDEMWNYFINMKYLDENSIPEIYPLLYKVTVRFNDKEICELTYKIIGYPNGNKVIKIAVLEDVEKEYYGK